MLRRIKKWILGLALLGLLFAGLLLTIILNPILIYANKSVHNGFTIYHNKSIDPLLPAVLDKAKELLKKSEFYKDDLDFNICLNDGSSYPKFVKMLLGPAFAWAIYDKVILQGEMKCGQNVVELNVYQWNLIELLGHEMTHCLQCAKLGLWKSNPVARIPDWKWEGYAEYIARQGPIHNDLAKNLDRFEKDNKNSREIAFEDNTIAPRALYKYQLMVRYCIEIKKLSYSQLLSNPIDEGAIKKEMKDWYVHKQRTNNHQTYAD